MNIFLIIGMLCVQFSYAPPKPIASKINELSTEEQAILEAKKNANCEPMGIPGAPLGGIWVNELPDKIFARHFEMGQHEKNEAKVCEKKATNFATFSLCCVLTNDLTEDTHYLLMPKKQSFFSSDPNIMLLDANSQDLIIEEEVATEYKITTQEINDKKAEIKKKIDQCDQSSTAQKLQIELSTLMEELKNVFELLEKQKPMKQTVTSLKEKYNTQTYFSHIFGEDAAIADKKVHARYYAEDKNRADIYDTEQLIVRIIDAYMTNLNLSDIKNINGQNVNGSIKYFILNLHTRFDMCPFCLMYLASHVQKWEEKYENKIPFLAVVSSRQDYLCDSQFINGNEKKYNYNGVSMRSIGNHGISMHSIGKLQVRRQREEGTASSVSVVTEPSLTTATTSSSSVNDHTIIKEIKTIKDLEKISFQKGKRLVVQYLLPITIYDEEIAGEEWSKTLQAYQQREKEKIIPTPTNAASATATSI